MQKAGFLMTRLISNSANTSKVDKYLINLSSYIYSLFEIPSIFHTRSTLKTLNSYAHLVDVYIVF